MMMATTMSIASSIAFSNDIELPRYRGSNTDNRVSCPKERETLVQYNSISSSTSANTMDESTTSVPATEISTIPPRPITKILTFHRSIFHTDITIHNKSAKNAAEIPIYHAATSEWNFSRPDVVLHAGSDSTGSVLGVAYFRWSRNARMGMGDPVMNESGVVWEELRNTSAYYTHGKYEFEYEEPSSINGVRRRQFMWQRTHAAEDGVEGWSGWLSWRNYKLVDMQSMDMIGVFLANDLSSLTKKGELRMFSHVSKELEMVIVLSMACISEKATRRGRYQRNGNGGP
jgi:hypothetical protein